MSKITHNDVTYNKITAEASINMQQLIAVLLVNHMNNAHAKVVLLSM